MRKPNKNNNNGERSGGSRPNDGLDLGPPSIEDIYASSSGGESDQESTTSSSRSRSRGEGSRRGRRLLEQQYQRRQEYYAPSMAPLRTERNNDNAWFATTTTPATLTSPYNSSRPAARHAHQGAAAQTHPRANRRYSSGSSEPEPGLGSPDRGSYASPGSRGASPSTRRPSSTPSLGFNAPLTLPEQQQHQQQSYQTATISSTSSSSSGSLSTSSRGALPSSEMRHSPGPGFYSNEMMGWNAPAELLQTEQQIIRSVQEASARRPSFGSSSSSSQQGPSSLSPSQSNSRRPSFTSSSSSSLPWDTPPALPNTGHTNNLHLPQEPALDDTTPHHNPLPPQMRRDSPPRQPIRPSLEQPPRQPQRRQEDDDVEEASNGDNNTAFEDEGGNNTGNNNNNENNNNTNADSNMGNNAADVPISVRAPYSRWSSIIPSLPSFVRNWIDPNSNSNSAARSTNPSKDGNTRRTMRRTKQRISRRRQRFRQGIQQIGFGLNTLTEGDDETATATADQSNSSNTTQQNATATAAGDGSITTRDTDNNSNTSSITGPSAEDRSRQSDQQSDYHYSCCSFSNPKCQAIMCCILCFIISFGIVFGIIVAIRRELIFGGDDEGNNGSGSLTPPPGPTITVMPPYNPDDIGQPLVQILPEDTISALADPSSPQAQAFKWVEEHPNSTKLPNWKKLQLMALGSFYHAFHGDGWPEQKKSHWLDYDYDECEWGDATTEEYFGNACHENGTIKDLNLDWFLGHTIGGFPAVLEGKRMPNEIQFLTQLESLGILNAGCKATLEDMLPSTLARIPTLKQISFKYNRLGGTLPSWVGDITALTYLSIGNNFVTGTLPSELGLLTHMKEVFLYGNHLEGSIPKELAAMTDLVGFSAIHNQLSGTIPSEFAAWTKLEWLYLDHNPLQGTVPEEMCLFNNISSILIDCTAECPDDCTICECYD